MKMLKTKDAALLLGVSQTTVKRWASQYTSTFRKDPLGHYAFTSVDLELLFHVKDQIELGKTLEQISLPGGNAVEAPRAAEPPPLFSDAGELLSRLDEVERSVRQKADEVVSAQVLQHRTEIDELRQMVAQLAAALDKLQPKAPGTAEQAEFRLPPPTPAPSPAKKKGFFRRH
ncbi:MerR family transcriptional regulator [Cohnella suwonensis]|uniref:MerR family transcriptional regulator n=1 Tax=Cohnella suwonensis TaxID=696072 RepID=A0ABW0LZ48_9BACL